MRRSVLVQAMVLGLAAGFLSGCFRATELSQMRRDIEQEVPQARFEKELELTLGPRSLGFVRLLRALSPQGREDRELLADIERVKMAVYGVQSMPSLEGFQLPRPLRRLLEGGGWEEMAKVRDQDECFWLLYRLQGAAVRDLYIVGLDPKELLLVHLEGRLDRVLARAVESHPEQIVRSFRMHDDWGRVADAGPTVGAGRDAANSIMPDFRQVEEEEGWWFRYNRVDGVYLPLGGRWPRPGDRRDWYHGPDLWGELGYAFSGKHWRYQVSAEIPSPFWRRGDWPSAFRWHWVSGGAEFHRLTDSQDSWVISEDVNTAAALLFRRDFRDYYRRSGWSVYSSYHLGKMVQLTGRLAQDEFASLENSVDWGLFEADWARPAFRPNPAVDERRISSLRAEVQMDTRNHRDHPRRGWLAAGLAEKAGGFLQGDSVFRRYMLDLRRYQPVGRGTRLDLRTRLGTATGELPVQYRYALGGYSSLRGYRFKEFTGDRMALGNAEVWIEPGRYLDDRWPHGLCVGAFLDAGAAWSKGGLADEPGLKASHGWAISLPGRDDVSICVAKPIQVERAHWDLSFRIGRSF